VQKGDSKRQIVREWHSQTAKKKGVQPEDGTFRLAARRRYQRLAAPDQFLAVAFFRFVTQEFVDQHQAQRKRGTRQQAPPGFHT
jgi:hypothetical protein